MKASACHILVKTKEQAEKLKQELDKGANFQQLAKKYSICSSAKRGGDLGEFGPGQMVKAFDNVVFILPSQRAKVFLKQTLKDKISVGFLPETLNIKLVSEAVFSEIMNW